VVRTELLRSLDGTYASLSTQFLKTLLSIWWFVSKNSIQAAQTTIYLAIDKQFDTTTRQYFSDCAKARTTAAAMDDASAARLWHDKFIY
ncbi:unnamed protein product, partial [Didymodactylos carnosus]